MPTSPCTARSAGPRAYEIFDEWMRADARALMELETDLRRAVERNEFSVLYQPLIALDRGELWGFEALVRWEHPTRGRTLPSEFLSLADETGLIVAIDRIVLDETCKQLRRWTDAFPSRTHHVSVNLSSRQFQRDDLVDAVIESVEDAGIDKRALGLEITEGTIMENAARATQVLAELRARGVQWSIDDFGTGYSSLSYLHRFPVDILKIDQSFVRRIGPRGENTEIIRTIMSLARSLGMRVVAEGVETPEQVAHLVARGCDYGQGYYFAHPLEAAKATEMIRHDRRPEWAFAAQQ
jgi:EAL domain-containing protein (putative c-di-GMP-specific phosphodiesterase class I)